MIPPFLILIIAFFDVSSFLFVLLSFISSVGTSGLDGYTFQVGGVARISSIDAQGGRSFLK